MSSHSHDKSRQVKSKPTKQELLHELESIRASLSETDELDLNDIPVLVDSVQHEDAAHTAEAKEDDDNESLLRAAYKSTLAEAEELVASASDPLGYSEYDPEDYDFELKLDGIVDEVDSASPAESEEDTQTRFQARHIEHDQKNAQDEPHYEQQLEALAEPPLHDEAPLKPLPGQQSLFDDSSAKNALPKQQAQQNNTDNEHPVEAPDPEAASKQEKSKEAHFEPVETQLELTPVEKEPASESNATEAESEEKPQESAPYIPPKAHGENPFLPQHIRERLTSSRNQLMEDLAQVDNTLKKPPQGKPSQPSAFQRDGGQEDKNDVKTSQKEAEQLQRDIIDQLVQKFLPEIEAELRLQLEKQLTTPQPSSDSPQADQ